MVKGSDTWKKINADKGNTDTALFEAACMAFLHKRYVDLLMDDKKIYALQLSSVESPNGSSGSPETSKADATLTLTPPGAVGHA